MTENREAQIRELAGAAETARMNLENQAMMNTPTDRVERIKAAREYALAQARFHDARTALTRAIEGVSS